MRGALPWAAALENLARKSRRRRRQHALAYVAVLACCYIDILWWSGTAALLAARCDPSATYMVGIYAARLISSLNPPDPGPRPLAGFDGHNGLVSGWPWLRCVVAGGGAVMRHMVAAHFRMRMTTAAARPCRNLIKFFPEAGGHF